MERTMLRWAAAFAAVLILAAGIADAQEFTAVRPGGRAGNWEFYFPFTYADSAKIDGQNGSHVDIDPGFGFGFGFGYNVTDHLNLNGLFTWNSRTYQATIVQDDGQTRKYNNIMDTTTLSLNGTYYFLKGAVAPFISGGVGMTYLDTNIPTSAASSACWWDPWWGYVCSSYVPTKTENSVSYNAGVGVRFELNRQFSLQGSYNKTWIDMSRASGNPGFEIWRIDCLFRM